MEYLDAPSSVIGTPPNQLLYFHSNRPGGLGADDNYVVQITCEDISPPKEVAAPGSNAPVYLVKDTTDSTKLKLSVKSDTNCTNAYNVYENDFGDYTSTNQLSCGNIGTLLGSNVQFSVTPTKPSQYFIVTGSNTLGEGPSGSIPAPLSCGPF